MSTEKDNVPGSFFWAITAVHVSLKLMKERR